MVISYWSSCWSVDLSITCVDNITLAVMLSWSLYWFLNLLVTCGGRVAGRDKSNSEETKECLDGKNLIKNKNNRRNYDELKYKVIVDRNISNDNIEGNEKIVINDGNLIKNMKDKKYNDDINYEDFEKRGIHESFEEIEKLYEEALF